MFLGRNIFALLLIAYVKGEISDDRLIILRKGEPIDGVTVAEQSSVDQKPKWNLNFPHEVYVVAMDRPDEEFVGCIIELHYLTKVVVPRSTNPGSSVLRIRYRDQDGIVRDAGVTYYEETFSASFLALTLDQRIPESQYAQKASTLDNLITYNNDYRKIHQIVGKVNVDGEDTDINIGMKKLKIGWHLQIETDYKDYYHIVVQIESTFSLPKGASLVTKVKNQGMSVIGMFEKKEEGSMHFNIFDYLRVKIVPGTKRPAASSVTKTN